MCGSGRGKDDSPVSVQPSKLPPATSPLATVGPGIASFDISPNTFAGKVHIISTHSSLIPVEGTAAVGRAADSGPLDPAQWRPLWLALCAGASDGPKGEPPTTSATGQTLPKVNPPSGHPTFLLLWGLRSLLDDTAHDISVDITRVDVGFGGTEIASVGSRLFAAAADDVNSNDSDDNEVHAGMVECGGLPVLLVGNVDGEVRVYGRPTSSLMGSASRFTLLDPSSDAYRALWFTQPSPSPATTNAATSSFFALPPASPPPAASPLSLGSPVLSITSLGRYLALGTQSGLLRVIIGQLDGSPPIVATRYLEGPVTALRLYRDLSGVHLAVTSVLGFACVFHSLQRQVDPELAYPLILPESDGHDAVLGVETAVCPCTGVPMVLIGTYDGTLLLYTFDRIAGYSVAARWSTNRPIMAVRVVNIVSEEADETATKAAEAAAALAAVPAAALQANESVRHLGIDTAAEERDDGTRTEGEPDASANEDEGPLHFQVAVTTGAGSLVVLRASVPR